MRLVYTLTNGVIFIINAKNHVEAMDKTNYLGFYSIEEYTKNIWSIERVA
jgi:hypothetical protein